MEEAVDGLVKLEVAAPYDPLHGALVGQGEPGNDVRIQMVGERKLAAIHDRILSIAGLNVLQGVGCAWRRLDPAQGRRDRSLEPLEQMLLGAASPNREPRRFHLQGLARSRIAAMEHD